MHGSKVNRTRPLVMDELDRRMREEQTGHEPRPTHRRESPSPTRSTSHPYTETAQRKPYLPVEDLREPELDEGVSYRQKL